MKLLDYLEINHGSESRRIELWHGDLTDMPPSEAVHVLVVSAFPGSYHPVRGTLMGALMDKGISVAQLARNKETDLRSSCSCWLSHEIETAQPGIQFKHILCFEPGKLGRPTEVVGDIFRTLAPFAISDPEFTEVAMPLVSTGNVGEDVTEMVEALFTAAAGWLENGLPLRCIKIVEKSEPKAHEIKGAFSILKRKYLRTGQRQERRMDYDVFLSYCHKNTPNASFLHDTLNGLKPGIRIFLDRNELVPGMAWQDKLYHSIDSSRKVLAVLTPEYIESKACQEEFAFASLNHIRSGEKTLFPLLLKQTDLLPHMSKWQYADCMVEDQAKMAAACNKLVETLG